MLDVRALLFETATFRTHRTWSFGGANLGLWTKVQ
jgi:hypothetical protein